MSLIRPTIFDVYKSNYTLIISDKLIAVLEISCIFMCKRYAVDYISQISISNASIIIRFLLKYITYLLNFVGYLTNKYNI